MVIAAIALLTGMPAGMMAGMTAGITACIPCHQPIVASYSKTAHSHSSARADAGTILGSFSEGRNILRTSKPEVYFKMEWRRDGFYQTAFDHGKPRSERLAVVMGSGRRGQSYLFQKDSKLFQLPVSYSRAAGGWVSSPGYPEGNAYFDREIQPSCLSCHSTLVNDKLLPGIDCRKCHGDADRHSQLRNPARLGREEKIAVCAACHGGKDSDPKAEVHGNQVALLRRSRCFQQSEAMTCGSCHNIHTVERDVVALSSRCAACHEKLQCKQSAAADNCIDCHMPKQQSVAIQFRMDGKPLAQTYRTHAIAVYR